MTRRDTTWISAFGQHVRLETCDDPARQNDSLWRCREIYERALAEAPLPATGLAVDIGAGFGAFAIPFALAFPGWTLWCFEPVAEVFAALEANIAAYGLAQRVIAVPAAVAGGASSAAVTAALGAGDPVAVAAATARATFHRDANLPMFVTANPDAVRNPVMQPLELPVISAAELATLGPDLLKFVAPGAEAAILDGFGDALPARIVGESWQMLPHRLLRAQLMPDRRCHVPVAGRPFRLRQAPDPSGRRPGLDVVIALHDNAPFVEDCIAALLAEEEADLRVIVVDDGATDDSGDRVAARFGDHRRVRLLQNPDGGTASARNAGRMASDASHIAFVDADDLPDPALFPTLLELARQTGAPIVQGGYDRIIDDGAGGYRFEPGESELDQADSPRHRFGEASCFSLPARGLIASPPTVWRRVYRRDYLDHYDIWFPEHVRAFDGLLFEILSLYHAGPVYCIDHLHYHRRQHERQARGRGDARAFYQLDMFRQALKRLVAEGWNDFRPVLLAFVDTVNRSLAELRPELRGPFLDGAADLWVLMRKVLGDRPFDGLGGVAIADPGFAPRVAEIERRLARFGLSYAWAYLDAPGLHPDIVSAGAAPGAN